MIINGWATSSITYLRPSSFSRGMYFTLHLGWMRRVP